MQATTTKVLKNQCQILGCTLELDEPCQCYRATAPDGKRFAPGLHELVAVFGSGYIGNNLSKADARSDLAYRLRGYAVLEDVNA